MFTGLIQSIGIIRRHSNGVQIDGYETFATLSLGDSIAVDGVCLTVASHTNDSFYANVSEETLSRTTLGLKASKFGPVNLEPALRLCDRLGGHLVSGHIDGLGKIISIKRLDSSWEITISLQDISYGRYICEKASICINGISLTVANCSKDGSEFVISVIPHTWDNTTLNSLQDGDLINLEADILAKYVEKLSAVKNSNSSNSQNKDDISIDWLARNGWA